MNKKYIIKDTREFTYIINKKIRIQNKYYVIYTDNKKEKQNRFGISVPKKVGNAVIRNKIKRQTKEIIRKNQNNFELSVDCIIIIKKAILEIDFSERKENLNQLLNKLYK